MREAGAEAVLLPLGDPAGLAGLLEGLDGFVLPGSPADVEPEQYDARNTGLSEPADKPRERTDWAVLEHALRERKPVLAICYGCQSLNVYLGGTLVQDVRWETGTTVAHRRKDVTPEAKEDPAHEVKFLAGKPVGESAWRGASGGEQLASPIGAETRTGFEDHGAFERWDCGERGVDGRRELGSRGPVAPGAHEGRPTGTEIIFGFGCGGRITR